MSSLRTMYHHSNTPTYSFPNTRGKKREIESVCEVMPITMKYTQE